MGSIIDVEEIDKNARCSNVKYVVIFINLIGCPIALLLLLFGIIKMLSSKKRLSFLTYIILFIFFSEMMNIISKLIQLIKYAFEDYRTDKKKDNSFITARGVICQIQIVTSIVSDFCSLLGTLLLSIRCNEIIKSKKRFFDKKKIQKLSICLIILISIAFSISFLFIDRKISYKSIGYKFDIRDRCSYWCWLEHTTSKICYGFYFVILCLNIYFAYKTNSHLKKGYKRLIEQSVVLIDDENSKDNINPNSETSIGNQNDTDEGIKKKTYVSEEDKIRIEELGMMKVKCFIYPITTIVIWGLSLIYRSIDDIFFSKYDDYEDQEKYDPDKEKNDLNDNVPLKNFVQTLLVFHTFLSTMRGILYGLSFIVFEERIFWNCFRRFFKKCCCCCNKFGLDYLDLEDNDRENKESMNDQGEIKFGRESKEEEYRKSTASDLGRNTNEMMNNSDYY